MSKEIILKKVILLSAAALVFSQTGFCESSPRPLTAVTPAKLLPDGVDAAEVTNPFTKEKAFIRKGTIASFYNNIALLDQLLALPDSKETREKLERISSFVKENLSGLRALGLFDVFTPKEWVQSDGFQGRILVGVYYLEAHPKNVTEETKEVLSQQHKGVTAPYLKEAIASVLNI